jgi:FKBP-type peptidyl-prolyl cis-trans isomerase
MKKSLLLLCLLAAGVTGCQKQDDLCSVVTTTAPAGEVAELQAYITDNHIEADKDSRGFFYTIPAPGSGTRPTACATVTVNYTGKLTSGFQVDAASNISFNLKQLISGWQEGLPLIAKGGRIILYLPPSLAYGAQANGNIPANSILIFSVELLDVQ